MKQKAKSKWVFNNWSFNAKLKGPTYRPGICTECFRPKELCWSTGESEPESEALTSNTGVNVHE